MRRMACAATLVAAVSGCSDPAGVLQPQDDAQPSTSRASRAAKAADKTAYEVVTFSSSLGGTVSRGNGLNPRGWVAGFSNLPDGTRHAALWRDGAVTDLGTLGGPHSSVAWPGINNRGLVVGIVQTATLDPLGELWSCVAFFPTVTGNTCLGFVWEDGVMTALPTLGGNNGYAASVNSRGQVVGWAETPVHDPTCDAPQVLQFRAVLWEPKRGLVQELPPLPGDSASAATAINQRGQVVGISGECDQAVGRFTAQHAVLWDKGTVTELPNLGGESWHTPTAINERGDVVGFSNPPGDVDGSFIAHAFLWTRKGGIRDLGTLAGDEISQAQAINARGQVVGVSCGATCRAFLWDDGVMWDLNTLVEPGFAGTLVSARDLTNSGRITGDVLVQSAGTVVPYVATPRSGKP